MKTTFLLPNSYKKIGWILLCTTLLLIILSTGKNPVINISIHVFAINNGQIFQNNEWFVWIENSIIDELICLFFILGSFFVGFSKAKFEDEYISKIRLESLAWVTYLNYGVLFISILFVYGSSFLTVLVYNLFTTLIFFLLRFNWLIYKSKKLVLSEK